MIPPSRSLFRKCPEAKVLFGFPLDMDPGSNEMQQSKHFVKHAANMISMLDRALNMLGPDAELLAEILSDRKFFCVTIPVKAV